MYKLRLLGIFVTGISLVLGVVVLNTLKGNTSLLFAADANKNFTIDATNCSPTGNQQYNSVVTGKSSDIETYLNITNGGTKTYGNGTYIFQDQGALGSQPTGDFYIGVNNLTAFTFVFATGGLSGNATIEASLYRETLITGLGTPTVIDIKGKSGIEQTVTGGGYRILKFHFNDIWISSYFGLASVNVEWSC